VTFLKHSAQQTERQ